MKLALMLMAGSALVFVGLMGLYFSTGINGTHSFDLIEISQMHISTCSTKYFLPFCIYRLWNICCTISLSYLGA